MRLGFVALAVIDSFRGTVEPYRSLGRLISHQLWKGIGVNKAVDSSASLFAGMEGQWIGDLRGNAIGSIFADSKIIDRNLVFDVRVRGQQDTIGFFRGVMQRPDEMILIEQKTGGASAPGPVAARLTVAGFTPDQVDGTVELENGAKSAVWLYRVKPEGLATATAPAIIDPASVQVVQKETTLPTMTLPRQQLDALVSQIKVLLPGTPIYIAANLDGKRITQVADAFLSRSDLPRSVNHLRVIATDTNRPIHRSLFIALSNLEPSRLVVTSDDPVWTSGAHQHLTAILDRSVGRMMALYHKHGLNLNTFVFLMAIVFMPNLPLLSRFVFLGITLLVLFAMKWAHSAITPVTVDLRDVERGWLGGMVLELSGAAVAAVAGGAIAFISTYLEHAGGVTEILQKLLSLGAP